MTATIATSGLVICYSRTCECGAIGLAAPPWDIGEITDDAISLFGVESHPESRGFDWLLKGDSRRSGVEVRMGELVQGDPEMPNDLKFIWFRRASPGATGPA
jgi:hypothetical protein